MNYNHQVIRLDRLKSAFPNIKTLDVISRGNSSVICTNKNQNKVTVYTTDKAKILWFEKLGSIGYKLLDVRQIGSAYAEKPMDVYKIELNYLFPLKKAEIKRVTLEILNPIAKTNHLDLKLSLKLLSMKTNSEIARTTSEKLKNFIDNNYVACDLGIEAFMSDSKGNIFCVDPVYSIRF